MAASPLHARGCSGASAPSHAYGADGRCFENIILRWSAYLLDFIYHANLVENKDRLGILLICSNCLKSMIIRQAVPIEASPAWRAANILKGDCWRGLNLLRASRGKSPLHAPARRDEYFCLLSS